MSVILNYKIQNIILKNLLLLGILIVTSCSSQNQKNNPSASKLLNNPIPTEMKSKNQARIEVYTEKNLGRPNAGADKFNFPDGKVQYGGKADYKPFIKKCTYTLNQAALAELLKEKLTFQAYFKESKPDITLGDYFNSLAIGETEKHRSLFPKDLFGFLSFPEVERNHYNTLLNDQYSESIISVFLNDSTWYVDKAFYSSHLWDKLKNLTAECNEKYLEGSLRDFIKLSPIVQRKTNEGIADLGKKHLLTLNYPTSGVVAAIGRHDGRGQGTWAFEIMYDGTINYEIENKIRYGESSPIVKSTYASPQKIGELLMLYNKNVASPSNSISTGIGRPGHDEDPMYIKIWKNGVLATHYLYDNDPQTPVWRNFIEDFNLLFADELGFEKQ